MHTPRVPILIAGPTLRGGGAFAGTRSDDARPGSGRALAAAITRGPNRLIGFGEARVHAATATFEVRVSEVASPHPGDRLAVGEESFVVQGKPERRDPDRLVWSLDGRRT